MDLQLGSEIEFRILEHIRTGKYATPAEVVLAGLESLEERERAQADDLDHIRRQRSSGLGNLDGGTDLDGESVFRELLADVEQERENNASDLGVSDLGR